MKMFIKPCLFISLGALSMTLQAEALKVEHVLWEKTPIQISLPIGEERIIRFPGPISIVESELNKDTGLMKLEDSLYLNAKNPFKNKKLIAQLMPDGEAIVLNLSANEDNHNGRLLEIIFPQKEAEAETEAAAEQIVKALSSGNEKINQSASINPVSLTRFAIQSLYSPERLLVTPADVRRVAMETHKTIALIYGAGVMAHPLISWEAEGLFITAVELQNTLNKKTVLDPRNIMGEWQSATFYPTNTLSPRGSHETTTVFLVSGRPFKEALSSQGEYVR